MSDVAIVWTIGLAVVLVFAALHGRAAVRAVVEFVADVREARLTVLDCGCERAGVEYGCMVCGFTGCAKHRADGHNCNVRLRGSR